ncbi:hypothetical protein AQUCO_02800137v1 [Aquilegia coerulea]|uniref:peptidylprolyl isomerase n=1 Tax=Aquilegia coerulea TaxID=218851 RepID=A0A2G5D437_AQUCA|nr:hypothetical protein AQUCO_02800137v1 [Aquilegia coerulea]
MEVCSISTTSHFKSSFRHLRCHVDKESYGDHIRVNKNKNRNFASLKMSRVSRRLAMEVLGFSSMVLHAGIVYGAPSPMVEMKEPPQVSRIYKLPSGVKIEDIVEGEGPEAREGDLVEVNYVCRRYNGYFVHSTVDQFSGESTPVILPLVDKQIIKGLKEVLVGMKVGGKPGVTDYMISYMFFLIMHAIWDYLLGQRELRTLILYVLFSREEESLNTSFGWIC